MRRRHFGICVGSANSLQITTGVLGQHCTEAPFVRHRLEQLRTRWCSKTAGAPEYHARLYELLIITVTQVVHNSPSLTREEKLEASQQSVV